MASSSRLLCSHKPPQGPLLLLGKQIQFLLQKIPYPIQFSLATGIERSCIKNYVMKTTNSKPQDKFNFRRSPFRKPINVTVEKTAIICLTLYYLLKYLVYVTYCLVIQLNQFVILEVVVSFILGYVYILYLITYLHWGLKVK